jgi:hypothetical protein
MCLVDCELLLAGGLVLFTSGQAKVGEKTECRQVDKYVQSFTLSPLCAWEEKKGTSI